MEIKPVVFDVSSVRAVLNEDKTTLRQVVKDPYYIEDEDVCRAMGFAIHKGTGLTHGMPYPDSPYRSGDILFVREPWYRDVSRYMYMANYSDDERFFKDGQEVAVKWKPSVNMPRDAARIFLRILDVRVERLQDITVDGILSEGFDVTPPPICTQGEPTERQKAEFAAMSKEKQDEFIRTLARHTHMGWCQYADELFGEWQKVWDSAIAPENRDKHGWKTNPWVWVVSFEQCGKPELF